MHPSLPQHLRLAATALALAAAALPAQAAGPLVYSFDSDDQGWTVFDGGAPTFQASGGNGGGFLAITDTTGGDFLAVAPAALAGDRSAWLGGTLAFDALNLSHEAPDWSGFGQVTLRGAGLTLVQDTIADNLPPNDGQWHRYTVPLTVAVWGADLPTVLGALTGLAIKGEFHNGVSETVGLDDITLAPVPEPTPAALLAAGLAGLGLLARARRR